MQFQPDARSTKLHLPVRFVYHQNLPAGQSTAVDMLRRCHADACDLHARPGSEWARQNLDLYESCWLSLTGYSQCYVPEWLTMMAASLARAASQRSGSTDQ